MTCDGLVMVGCHFAPESHLKNILIVTDKKCRIYIYTYDILYTTIPIFFTHITSTYVLYHILKLN